MLPLDATLGRGLSAGMKAPGDGRLIQDGAWQYKFLTQAGNACEIADFTGLDARSGVFTGGL
jgi:hypothetical protein